MAHVIADVELERPDNKPRGELMQPSVLVYVFYVQQANIWSFLVASCACSKTRQLIACSPYRVDDGLHVCVVETTDCPGLPLAWMLFFLSIM
jgi:hypothetical protein